MDSIIFLVVALGAIIAGYTIDGGNITHLFHGAPAIIVFGGTIGAVGVSYPISELKNIGAVIKVVFSKPKADLVELIAYFKQIAFKTRKEGLLSIEEMVSGDDIDPFIKKGLQMVVDGIEPQTVKDTLELSVELIEQRHKAGIAIFESAGGYAPTLGIIGTVTSLVVVLASLSSDTSALGESISSAFIATLYGISSANLLWLPIATKLKRYNEIEMKEKNLIIEAILCIQEGINPNTLDEKLKGFLDKKQLAQYESQSAREGE
ncbi:MULTISPECIES: motility protein A [Clostridium]|uniref:motility protein A n=1 Tax=Clostridium TaxID=1485 RepID=UPI00069E21D7|nr:MULTISPECIES: motility protein A [Clostridium]KOF57437.1 flagellar motor protein MotA [Clostridium sp. DMHC 10]MCD2348379.1 motility protein A [Clostridium guangxiense]